MLYIYIYTLVKFKWQFIFHVSLSLCLCHFCNDKTKNQLKGFHGKLCETKIINNYCTEIVCQNGGQCNILDNGKEYCTCLKNYHGLYCEVEENQEEQNTELFRIEKDEIEMVRLEKNYLFL